MRFVDQAVAIGEESAQEADSLSFMTRLLVLATLPHSNPGDVPGFSRSNGNYSLIIQSGLIEVDGELKNVGIPYGVIPRLLMAWITTEVVRTKERKIILGHSLSKFMNELDMIPTGGRWGSITRLKQQMNRLFSARVTFQYNRDSLQAARETILTKERVLWWDDKHPYQGGLFESYILLEQEFFDEIINHPVPVDMRALKALKKSPMALDLYIWLTYRMSYLQKPTAIPWKSLRQQFGADYKTDNDFMKAAKKHLRRIQSLYPSLDLEEQRGRLILKPSPTHIAQI